MAAPTAKAEMRMRQEIVDTALAMSRAGLSPGRSGNVSARWGRGMLITPSGMAYDRLETEDIVPVGADGTMPPGSRTPSSEWHFHLAIYRARRDAGAIVHCHSRHATALACVRLPIPAFHYMVAMAGGRDIPVAPYATFGTPELAAAAAAALEGRDACLLAHHGQIALGASLDAALDLAGEVEHLAAQYLLLLPLGTVPVLDDAEMDRVVEKFKSYGQRRGRR